MKRLLTTILGILFLNCVFGQKNLVANGGFEEITGKLKSEAKIDVAENWFSLTATGADIFSEEAKDDGMGAPDNRFGREKPLEGANYAGFVAYAYQGKEPRSYINTTFTEPLKAGKKYCVRFHVSLSDIAKYATNNIGAHITDKEYKLSDSNEPVLVEANVMHSKNKVIETNVFWEPICGVYTAKGGEMYLSIGNFYTDKGTDAKKMKKAPQFKQAQINVAYYFVDEVSVTEYNESEGCECEREEYVDVPNVIHKVQDENISLDNLSEKIAKMKIHFDTLSSELKGEALNQVKELASFMQSKSSLTIVIVGHCNEREVEVGKKNQALANISTDRAKAVGEYLAKSGINKTRFKTEGVKNTRPFVYGHSVQEQIENCAAHIEVLTE